MKRNLLVELAIGFGILILLALTNACGGSKTVSQPTSVTAVSVEEVRAADKTKRIEEFDSLTKESLSHSDFCSASDQEGKFVNFLIHSDHALVDIDSLVGKDQIYNEYHRRHVAVAQSVASFVNHNQGVKLPDCNGIDPMYLIGDIWSVEEKLPNNQKSIHRELLIKVLRGASADELRDLRAPAWAVQDHARYYFRSVTSQYDLTKIELRQVGLNNIEICGITASVLK